MGVRHRQIKPFATRQRIEVLCLDVPTHHNTVLLWDLTMATEIHQRCNYWPNCKIHLGVDRPKQFSQEIVAEMVSMHQDNESIIGIARTFDTSPQTVSRILRRSLGEKP